MKRRIIAALLAASMVVPMVAGCAKKDDTTSKGDAPVDKGPVTMEWLVGQTSAVVNDDAEVVKKIEERFNIDLKTWYIDSSKFNETLNVKFAAGEMPDVLVLEGANMQNYVEGGILHEVPIDMIRKKAPNYTKVADANDDGTMWTSLMYKGKNYGIAQPMDVVPMSMIWRKDWLDRVGITKVPETLEETEAALKKFVDGDPDGDGKKNTAGMAERAMNGIFGAYGLRIVTGAGKGFKIEEMQLGEDKVPFFPSIRPEAKQALELMVRWYKEGIIDKEFVTGENHGGYQWLSHSFMNNKIGLTSAQPYHYLNAGKDTKNPANYGVCMKELKGLNANADIAFGKGPVGPTGKSGTEGWAKSGRLTGLTTKCFNDQRKVDAFFAMMDAYYTDMEYAKLVNYGIEGKHYKNSSNGPVRIMEGTELRKEGVLQVDFGSTVTFAENITPEKTKFGREVTGKGLYRFTAPAVTEFTSTIASLDTLTEQAYYDIITGKKPISYFDEYVAQFKKSGGEAAEKAVQKAFAEMQVKK